MASTVLLLWGGSASFSPPFFEPGFALLGSLGPLVSNFASGCAVSLLAVFAVGLASGLAALGLALSFSAGLTSATSATTSLSVAVLPCSETHASLGQTVNDFLMQSLMRTTAVTVGSTHATCLSMQSMIRVI